MNKTFLFSIDLEDVRFMIPNGMNYKPGIFAAMPLYFDFLKSYKSKCTFFVVGDIARAYPELVQEIIHQGHEIACHSDTHVPLNLLSDLEFNKDIEQNLESLTKAGASDVVGFRAPTLSMTKSTRWAYKMLKSHGIKYSSSVLPAKSPLYGWPEFGRSPKVCDGVLEIPVTLPRNFPLQWPFGAGTYFRLLPWLITKRLFLEASAAGLPVIGYFHPYDIDVEQERFMHPGLSGNKLMNHLMFVNRSRVIPRLNAVMKCGYEITPYRDFLNSQALLV